MSEFVLTPHAPLGGFHRDFDGITLAEVTGMSLVSIAPPLGGETGLETALKNAYGAAMPQTGSSTLSTDGGVRFIGLQPGQIFVLFPHEGDEAIRVVAEKLGDSGYYTDQSDSWAMLRISGPKCIEALERICMLDLSPETFPVDTATRTLMEHLGVILIRESATSFLLMSARSSAKSFLHAVETSAVNVS